MNHENTTMTFADGDIFGRMRYAEQAMKTINSHSDGACTIAIDAPWGVGKSTFIHMWKNEIENGNIDCIQSKRFETKTNLSPINASVFSVYYNAWEHDDSDNALLPLLWTVFTSFVDKNDSSFIQTPKFQTVSKHLGKLLGSAAAILASQFTLNGVLSNQTGSIINTLFDIATTESETSATEKLIKEYEKQKTHREELHKHLEAIAKEYERIIVFIDELDRCKPSFAIETLEAIKHFCDINNFTFVFAIDLTQLSHSIGTRYGNNMDTGGYLTKFFDHHFRLPTPSSSEMIRMENTKYNFSEIYDIQIAQILEMCSITPREISGVYKTANTLTRSIGFEPDYEPTNLYIMIIILLLVCMKKRKPTMYNAFINGDNWDTENIKYSYPEPFEILNAIREYRFKTQNECYKLLNNLKRNQFGLFDTTSVIDAVPVLCIKILEMRIGNSHYHLLHKLEYWLESVII